MSGEYDDLGNYFQQMFSHEVVILLCLPMLVGSSSFCCAAEASHVGGKQNKKTKGNISCNVEPTQQTGTKKV